MTHETAPFFRPRRNKSPLDLVVVTIGVLSLLAIADIHKHDSHPGHKTETACPEMQVLWDSPQEVSVSVKPADLPSYKYVATILNYGDNNVAAAAVSDFPPHYYTVAGSYTLTASFDYSRNGAVTTGIEQQQECVIQVPHSS